MKVREEQIILITEDQIIQVLEAEPILAVAINYTAPEYGLFNTDILRYDNDGEECSLSLKS